MCRQSCAPCMAHGEQNASKVRFLYDLLSILFQDIKGIIGWATGKWRMESGRPFQRKNFYLYHYQINLGLTFRLIFLATANWKYNGIQKATKIQSILVKVSWKKYLYYLKMVSSRYFFKLSYLIFFKILFKSILSFIFKILFQSACISLPRWH